MTRRMHRNGLDRVDQLHADMGEPRSAWQQVLELLVEQGFEGLATAMQTLFNEAMKLEREHVLGAAPYERTPDRVGHANGFKDRTLRTRVGELELRVPQTRGIEFYPQVLERGQRSERALALAVAEMRAPREAWSAGRVDAQGDGRDAATVRLGCDQLAGQPRRTEVGRGIDRVAHAAARRNSLSARRRALRARPRGGRGDELRAVDRHRHHARGTKNGARRACVAVGSRSALARVLRGVAATRSARRADDRERRSCGPGRRAASAISRRAVAAVPVSSRREHVDYVPPSLSQEDASGELRTIFNAATRQEADRLLGLMVDKYAKVAPKLSAWLEANVTEGLTVLSLPAALRRRLRTNNMPERLNREVKRRTRVAGLFPNENSLLRLATAVLMETDEEWQTEKRYLSLKPTPSTTKPN